MNVRAVIFDWAGTVVDHGSRGPVAALQEVFGNAGIPMTAAEARLDMGLAKKAHIAAILARRSCDADIEALYAAFAPKLMECLGQYSDVIPGVPAFVKSLRSQGVKIGSTTGYTRPMLNFLLEHARIQGFQPDAAFCPDDVPGGRPAPWMCWMNAIRLNVFPAWQIVKIGDTPSDIEEGRNAGMWTIAVTRTGNEVGLTEHEWEATPDEKRRPLLSVAEARLAAADYRAASAADCGPLLAEISARIAAGQRP